MDLDRIADFINKSEITRIVNRYFRALDEKNFDAAHFASIFTPQAKVTRPNGASLIGPEEISASHEKSFTRFEGSQHFVVGSRYFYRRQYGERPGQSHCHAHVAGQ